jgi:hypothetical protein
MAWSMGLLGASLPSVAGGAGAYDLLETQVLASAASSVTFTGLGSYSDYKHLQLRVTARSQRSPETNDGMQLYLNADIGPFNYAHHRLQGDGSSVTSTGSAPAQFIELPSITASGATTNAFGSLIVDILDFSNESKNTTIKSLGGAASNFNQIRLSSGLWMNTNAVTQIRLNPFFSNFAIGSRFSLYGVK